MHTIAGIDVLAMRVCVCSVLQSVLTLSELAITLKECSGFLFTLQNARTPGDEVREYL